MNKPVEETQKNETDKTVINLTIDAESWKIFKDLINNIDKTVNQGEIAAYTASQ